MKKLLVCVPFLMLTACMGAGTQPNIGLAPAPEMPDLPQSLAKKAERLPDLTGKTLAEREKEDARTDSIYNEKATQLNVLIDAYGCIKDALKSRKDATACFGGIL